MAKVLGETAKYVKDQSLKRVQKQLVIIIVVPYLFVIGLIYLLFLIKIPYPLIAHLVFILAVIGIALGVFWRANKVIEKLEKKRIDYRKGATGEELIDYILRKDFPPDYMVIPNLETPYGDIDHMVVGPSGIYAIDTKNWRGIVTADGKGELLLNEKPTSKPEVSKHMRRTMFFQEKIKVLTGFDPFIRAVFAFPSARVEAKWGTTRQLHCVRYDQLYHYIVEKKGKKLKKNEIDAVLGAICKGTEIEEDFIHFHE